jgi:hypothetical protein
LPGALQTAARNQFYIIEIDPADCAKYGIAGQVRSWDWSSGVGWVPASLSSGLPSIFGFGARRDPIGISDEVGILIRTSGLMKWDDICAAIPDTRFLIPQDQRELIRLLETRHQLFVSMDDSKIVEVGRLTNG